LSPGTLLLAKRGFMCRSAYEQNLSWADNVQRVAIGHTIHFYYARRDGHVQELGAFTVIEPHEHPSPALFGARVDGSALHRAADPSFIRRIDKDGAYAPDPKLGAFTGWVLRESGKARAYDRGRSPVRARLSLSERRALQS
jgi:hypothetical protein